MEKIKKVLLVNPRRLDYRIDSIPPFVLGYLASWVIKNNGVEVKICDEVSGDNAVDFINSFSPDLVGITAMTEFTTRAYEIAGFSKKRGILTVMGGKHAAVLPQDVAKHVDIVVKGPGEKALSDIINGRRDKIIEGDIVENIDDIPAIPWDLFNMSLYMKNYQTAHPLASVFWPSKLGFIMSSRGCPYSCIFCYNSSKNTKLQFMSPERIVKDIEELKEKYGIESFCFVDDNFFSHGKNLKKITDLFIKKNLNIKWMCAATVSYINEENLRAVKNAGCVQISFGFESGSDRILKLLKKGMFTIEDNLRAIELCKKVGIKVFGSFIIGTPTETKEDLEKTLEFIRTNKIDTVNLQIAKPYPGTELWDICMQKGLIPKDFSWDDYGTTSFSDVFKYEELTSYLVDMVDNVNAYTFSRAIQRIKHEPLIIFRVFYDKRFRNIIRRIIKNMFKKKEVTN